MGATLNIEERTDDRSNREHRTICVVGAGTMGHGIAAVCALAGHRVVLCDRDSDVLDAAFKKIVANYAKGAKLGKVTEAATTAALARLDRVEDLEVAARGVDCVVEAVPESIELKQMILSTAENVAATNVLLATNTSSLSVSAISSVLKHPSRLIGMHFFNPVHIMKLVEIVHHLGSHSSTIDEGRELAIGMGKTPIVVRDSPGFASSRLGLVIGLEAMRMLEEEVASAADIDTAMRLGYGHPMGPLELTDLVGLDVRLAIADYLATEIGPAFTAPQILRDRVASGHLGRKTGAGFFRWNGKEKTAF